MLTKLSIAFIFAAMKEINLVHLFLKFVAFVATYAAIGRIYYYRITQTGGLDIFVLILCAIILVPIAFFVPLIDRFWNLKIIAVDLGIWILGLALVCSSISVYDKYKNLSEVDFSAGFYWDAGLDVYFRKDGTYKVRHIDWVSGEISYGHYIIDGPKLIITTGELRIGSAPIHDTLLITSEGLDFKLNGRWKNITGGTLRYDRVH